MAKIYISYSKNDQQYAKEIADRLEKLGHTILIDYYLLKPSVDMVDVLQKALESADAFVVLITEHTLTSPYVNSEIGQALAHKKRIIPLVFPNSTVPQIISGIFHLKVEENNLQAAINEIEKLLSVSSATIIGHADEIRRLAEGGAIEDYGDWLNDLDKAFNKYQRLKEQVIGYFFNSSFNDLNAEQRIGVLNFLQLVWADKSFGSVGQSSISAKALFDNTELYFNATATFLVGLKKKRAAKRITQQRIHKN